MALDPCDRGGTPADVDDAGVLAAWSYWALGHVARRRPRGAGRALEGSLRAPGRGILRVGNRALGALVDAEQDLEWVVVRRTCAGARRHASVPTTTPGLTRCDYSEHLRALGRCREELARHRRSLAPRRHGRKRQRRGAVLRELVARPLPQAPMHAAERVEHAVRLSRRHHPTRSHERLPSAATSTRQRPRLAALADRPPLSQMQSSNLCSLVHADHPPPAGPILQRIARERPVDIREASPPQGAQVRPLRVGHIQAVADNFR